ncbi:MAG: transporter associated domain-containing protein [Pseudomonadota bacterium]|nr:transporter associated domain-containing protein [Pseudomonadota bacterium]
MATQILMMQSKKPKKKWIHKILDLVIDKPKQKSDLLNILRESLVNELIDNDSLTMIEGVFKVSEMQVREIMIPRPHMIVLDISDDIDEVIKKVVSSGHSRFPVIDGNRDEIIGVLLAKDLLKRSTDEEKDDFEIHELINPATFVPESKRLNILLNEFKTSRNHIAIVIDEHGGVSGLVTIEDVIEEIVGEIDDEHDKEGELKILTQNRNTFIVDALTSMQEFNNHFSTDFEDEDVETIGGYLINQFEKVPQKGDNIKINNLLFKILSADSRKINRIQVTKSLTRHK